MQDREPERRAKVQESQTRIRILSEAITAYGDASIEIYKMVKTVGNDVVSALPSYLGNDAKVFGVPPSGDWRADDYRDAKFSFHGAGVLDLEPISMGVAVAIPHIGDDGQLWVRTTVEFEPSDGALLVRVEGNSSVLRVPPPPAAAAAVEGICEAIFQSLLALWNEPLRAAAAGGRGRIGFNIP